MTTEDDRGGFLGRWSRLKREAAREEAPPPPPEPAEAPPPALEDEPPPATAAPAAGPPDLPPLESLGEGSDYRPFMAPGVPPELRRLALRKAWTSNPGIANFRGFADYDWDYNAPGYGSLLPVDDIRRLCDAVVGRLGEPGDGEESRPAGEAAPGDAPMPAPAPEEAPAALEVAAATPRPAERPLPGTSKT